MQIENYTSLTDSKVVLKVASAIARARRKPLTEKQKIRNKERAEELASIRKQYADRKNSETIKKNKFEYGAVYDEFFQRGGLAWYEALFSEKLDKNRILRDVEYFEKILARGIDREESIKRQREKDEHERKERLNTYRRIVVMGSMRGRGEVSTGEYRRALVQLGTSNWADIEKVKLFYLERDRLSNETGVKHHVDHIIPIVHPKVCGLNNEFNLRVIPASDNHQKSNQFFVDDPRNCWYTSH